MTVMSLDAHPVRETVLRILRELAPELARTFGARSILLFGSVARGEAGPESDVDLLVEFDRPVGLLELATLRRTLSEQLGRPVDVGTVDSLRPRARAAALAEAVRVA
jgi:predicted nucleotidyltransferase